MTAHLELQLDLHLLKAIQNNFGRTAFEAFLLNFLGKLVHFTVLDLLYIRHDQYIACNDLECLPLNVAGHSFCRIPCFLLEPKKMDLFHCHLTVNVDYLSLVVYAWPKKDNLAVHCSDTSMTHN